MMKRHKRSMILVIGCLEIPKNGVGIILIGVQCYSPDLKLCKNCLRDEGVVFISIGSDELDSLIKMSNEVFGEEKPNSHLRQTHEDRWE